MRFMYALVGLAVMALVAYVLGILYTQILTALPH